MKKIDAVMPNGCIIHYSKPRKKLNGDHSVSVTCPSCNKERYVSSSNLRRICDGKLSGRCQKCVGIENIGKKHFSWKGGRHRTRKDLDGYIIRHISTFSESEQILLGQMKRAGRSYILEHRAVMALSLGRPLYSYEIVHHLNGIKDDNRRENLLLTNAENHAGENQNVVRGYKNEIKRLQDLLTANHISC